MPIFFHSAKSRTNGLQQGEQMDTQLPWAMEMLQTIFNIFLNIYLNGLQRRFHVKGETVTSASFSHVIYACNEDGNFRGSSV